MKKVLILLGILLLVWGMYRVVGRHRQGLREKLVNYEAGAHRETLAVQNRERSYLVYIPDGFNPDKIYPLLLGFHGGGGDGKKFSRQTGLDEAADREGFIAVFPDGIAQNWNDGRDTTDAYKAGVDDVLFVRTLVERLKARLPIDEKRIYATGVSNGGIFSHRLACEITDVFAAVGPVVGPIATKFVPRCNPSAPISVIGIQGTADPGIPINGGGQGGLGGLGDGGFVESADATMRLWAEKNGCPAAPVITALPPKVNDGTSVKKYVYTPYRGGVEVHYYIVEGMGHGWPPPKEPQAPRLAGPTSQNINATETVLEFFKTHPKQ